MNSIIENLSTRGIKLIGCSPNEINEGQLLAKHRLPEFYLLFLTTFGKGAGDFMRGSHAYYPDVLELKEWANECLKENNLPLLPDDVFVFWMHQGYQFAYFYLDGTNNPEVIYFSEDSESQLTKKVSLEEYFSMLIEFSF